LRRGKKVLDEGYNCVMCHNSEEETAAHLFFNCPAAASSGLLWELFGGKFKCPPEALASPACFWTAFLHGNFYDWCLVPLETEK
jgi:hypothetical protein